MMRRRSGPMLWLISLVAGAGIAIVLVSMLQSPPAPPVSATRPIRPATIASAATAPSTQPQPLVIRTYGQLLHAEFANYPQTQPSAWNVDLTDAAHIILNDPVYVCPRGDLWITRADADPLPVVLARAADENEHIIDQPVRYIVWIADRKGNWKASAVCGEGKNLALVSATERRKIPWHRDYNWETALNWNDNGVNRLIVRTGGGVSVINIDSTLSESYCDLLSVPTTTPSTAAAPTALAPTNPPPQVLFDLKGLLAWIPADGDYHGPSHFARFVDGKWILLDPESWPSSIVHVVPMLDGSVLQLRRGEDPQSIKLEVIPLDPAAINQREIAALVVQLNDDDPEKRVAAFEHLTRYGQSIYPLLQKLSADAGPEAQSRLRTLMEGGLANNLGGVLINDSLLTVAARLRDGGVVFFAPRGISIPQDGQDPKVISPDYLVIRPNNAVRELHASIVEQMKNPGTLVALRDEWILSTPGDGPQRFLPPDRFFPLLRPSERKFSQPVAIDGHGRWVFSTLSDSSAAGSGTTRTSAPQTLILDPSVPDPTPRLAIWMIDTGTEAGWNTAQWPTLYRGATHWLVTNHEWEVMSEETDKMQTTLPPMIAPPFKSASPSATRAISRPAQATAATQASTTASSRPSPETLPLLLVDAEGNRYYDGVNTLVVIDELGNRRVWNLPPQCAGDSGERAWLVPDRQGRLYLLNSAKRIVRLHLSDQPAEPFVVEAIFNNNIPSFREIRRVWLDPAGRIAVAYEEWRLAIIFTTGQIPSEIASKALAQDVKRTDDP